MLTFIAALAKIGKHCSRLLSGPVEIVALDPARPSGLRSCGYEVPLHWAAGTFAFASVAVPSACDAPGHGPTDCLRQGVRFWCWPRRGRRSQGLPRFQPEFCNSECAEAGRRRHGVLRLTPNALPLQAQGFGGKTVISLISVAERNQHRHSMTPGRLVAVKDRGCPPGPAVRGGSAEAVPSLTA